MAQPAGAFLSDDWCYSEIRWASQELYFFDDVYARPLNPDPRSGTVIEAVAAARGTALVVWRGPRNRIGPATPVDEMWALIDSPDRAPGAPRVPQAVDPDAAGCGVLLPGEPTNGIVGRGIHALVTILENAGPVLAGLLGAERDRAYLRVNAAIIRGMRA
ncbi:hypothetical protein [Sinomonas sp. P47F7]|uniref:hypothetical protein n=1 Tax=Sinomonas sp. P47F7 TaxID=3410987 RepID=UPI003BF59159